MKKSSLLLLLISWACLLQAQPDIQRKLQAQFIEVDNNGLVELPEGIFTISTTLSMDGKQGVTIRGKGPDKTILNFAGQISGAEGIRITNGSNITIEQLTVQNTKGDAIKTQLVDGIRFLNVKTEWTRGAHSSNGGYGIYPVQCQRVLIDSCYARGSK